jgi:hypothetical protein
MLAPNPNLTFRALGELPAANSDTRVELITRTAEDGSSLLELVEYSWGTGLGWYVQKRMTLDATQVDALRTLLGSMPVEPPKPALDRPLVIREDNVIQLVFPS